MRYHFLSPDGTVITVIFQETNTDTLSAPSEAASPAPPAIEAAPADLGAAPMEERSRSPEAELWSAQKTRFLISKYTELNPLVGKKGGLKQVSFTFSLKC